MSVFQAFARTAAEHGARPFLEIVADTAARYGIEPRLLTYAETLQAVRLAADAFRSAGIAGGERVALLLGNTPECFIHWLALNLLGASVVPLNPDWRAAELEYALSHSEARLAVTRSPLARAALRCCGARTSRPGGRHPRGAPAAQAHPSPRAFRTDCSGSLHGMCPALHLRDHRRAQGMRPPE